MRQDLRQAFTLVELIIIIAVIGILAAIAVPFYSNSTDLARTETMAVNVGEIRTQILSHAGKGDCVLSAGGNPATIATAWFRNNTYPEHAFTGRPIVVDTVTLGPEVMYPAVKTFTGSGANAWYNCTNGAFCVRVPPMQTDAKTLEAFNAANKVGTSSLGQTTN